MAIVISGVNNNDRITATDGLIDSLSGFNFVGTISATTFNGNVTGNISGNNGVFGDFVNVGSNIQLGQAGILTATTFDGNVSGNINNSTLLLQTGGTERVRIDSSGHILIGGSSSRTVGFAHILQLEGTQTTPHSISNISNRADQHASHIDFAKSRGSSLGSTNIVQSNDYLGHILFRGADGTDLATPASRITGAVDGTPGSNNVPGRLEFWTQASGGSIAEKVRIDSDGRLLVNTTNNSNGHISASKLAVQGADLSIFKDSGGDNAGVSGHKLKFVTQSGSLGEIDVLSEGGGGPSGRGGLMRFYTKANNTASATERLRITSDGIVEVKTSGGAATFRIRSGGDQEIYAANDTDKVSLYCDTHQVLTVDGRVSSTNLVSSQVIGYSPNYPAESALEIKNAVSGTPDNDWYWIKQYGNVARLHYCVFKDQNGSDIAGGPWTMNWVAGVIPSQFSSNGSTSAGIYLNLCKNIGIDKPGRGMESSRTTAQVYGAWLAVKRALWDLDPGMFHQASTASGGVLIMPIININGEGGSSDHRVIYSTGTGTHIPPNQDGDHCNASQLFCGWWGGNDYSSWTTNNNAVPSPEDWGPGDAAHTGDIGKNSNTTPQKVSFRDKMLVTCIYH